MSTATAAAEAAGAPAAKGGKKKLLIIIAAVVVLLAAAGGGTVFYLKSKAAAAAAEEGEEEHAKADAKKPKAAAKDPKQAPTFVPLDPFTVNLADREAERYAQVGITLEVTDAKQGDSIKVFMPVIRNNILMVLSHKTSAELLERDGKTKLAGEIQRETVRALGVEVEDEEAEEDAGKATKKKKKRKVEADLPVTAVHFSNFIIQ